MFIPAFRQGNSIPITIQGQATPHDSEAREVSSTPTLPLHGVISNLIYNVRESQRAGGGVEVVPSSQLLPPPSMPRCSHSIELFPPLLILVMAFGESPL